MSTASVISQFVLLRTLVGFLGEKEQESWWNTSFLGNTGLEYLKITFPRSYLSAGVNSVTEAAKRLHDKRIGKSGVFHLFRFPLAIEERIHRALLASAPESLIETTASSDHALERLGQMASDEIKPSEGPLQIETRDKMLTTNNLSKIAAHYLAAFQAQNQSFPYFAAKEQ